MRRSCPVEYHSDHFGQRPVSNLPKRYDGLREVVRYAKADLSTLALQALGAVVDVHVCIGFHVRLLRNDGVADALARNLHALADGREMPAVQMQVLPRTRNGPARTIALVSRRGDRAEDVNSYNKRRNIVHQIAQKHRTTRGDCEFFTIQVL